MIPAPPPGTNAEDGAAGSERPSSNAPDLLPAARALPYADFAAALKDALRDFHSADLLARNPLLRDGIYNFAGSAGPLELKAMLVETVSRRRRPVTVPLAVSTSTPFLPKRTFRAAALSITGSPAAHRATSAP